MMLNSTILIARILTTVPTPILTCIIVVSAIPCFVLVPRLALLVLFVRVVSLIGLLAYLQRIIVPLVESFGARQ
ncbi:uncharacterized protein F4822DRAFT_400910 [Hypoxylon trugodes]|uniref:uncharacterized protein n=1 Tax=Hypoxylon trugodes TaxID=326681 RepID=UPI002197F440|nr:uncharacterized protein F4822DRAFT_400910 [Hypoxylon trugodes]KAI1390112.1 hypothetical protein F4822DRAFT_400910 [Hypoxylon trugodes]